MLETLIWLTEAPDADNAGIDIIEMVVHLKEYVQSYAL